jgi:hypothetical protein
LHARFRGCDPLAGKVAGNPRKAGQTDALHVAAPHPSRSRCPRDLSDGVRVRVVAEENVYKVLLVSSNEYRVDTGYLYRGELPEVGQKIDVENKLDRHDRRRAEVTEITGNREALVEGPLIHARELEP